MAVESHGSRLGLARATMRIYGRTFVADFGGGAETPGECWSLRVPLNGGGAMDLEAPFGAGSTAVAAFADCLRTAMVPKLESFRPQMAFAAGAGRGSMRLR